MGIGSYHQKGLTRTIALAPLYERQGVKISIHHASIEFAVV